MRNLLLVLFLFSAISVGAQSLNTHAEYIKTKFPTDYTNTIRKHAVEEWGTDHRMIVYTINQQADALFDIVNTFKTENTQILYDAAIEWSHDGYKSSNITKFNDLKTVNVESMIKLHCDWRMVKYTYEKQVTSKAAY